MTTENDLLDGIAAHPSELERWLILADWLEDHGDPRAELARLRLDPGQAARQVELVASGLPPVVPTRAGSLALILPGTFWMGSPADEADRHSGEVRHEVMLTEPFYLGVYPVTVGEFAAFVRATDYQAEGERVYDGATWRNPGFAQNGLQPVVCVTWNDAQAMTEWLNEQQSELTYALPTEAQWEYACRAGTETAYWWGDEENRLSEFGWFVGNAGDRTHPVETKKPNPWGLFHMHGHVWEWCQDWYTAGQYSLPAATDPVAGFTGGNYRVQRGGAWDSTPRGCRSAYRGLGDPVSRNTRLGFRLAASVRSR